MVDGLHLSDLDDRYVNVTGDTMTGVLNVKSTSSYRANINMISIADVPNDFYFGSNNTSHWSITSRASNENNLLAFYSVGYGYTAKVNYSTGIWNFTANATISGNQILHSGNTYVSSNKGYINNTEITYTNTSGTSNLSKFLLHIDNCRSENIDYDLNSISSPRGMQLSLVSSSQTLGTAPPYRTSKDGPLLTLMWDGTPWGDQLHFGMRYNDDAHWRAYENGTWQAWKTFLDSANYTTFVNNYYWANVKISTTSNPSTTPTFRTLYLGDQRSSNAYNNILTIFHDCYPSQVNEYSSYNNEGSWGIGFDRGWSTSNNSTNSAGIYAYGGGSWSCGLIFRVKGYNGYNAGHNITALDLTNDGIVKAPAWGFKSKYLNIGDNTLSTYTSSRAEVDIVSYADDAMDLWLGCNNTRTWNFSARGSSQSYVLRLYSYVDNPLFYVYGKIESNNNITAAGTLTANGSAAYINGNCPSLYINNTNTNSDHYSIIRFGVNNNVNSAYIFVNGPNRTIDGGKSMMTIRNNIGNLRLNNITNVTGKLTGEAEVYFPLHVAIGANLSTYESSRAEMDIVTAANNPCDLWLGANGGRRWYISCRNTSENYNLLIGPSDNSSGIISFGRATYAPGFVHSSNSSNDYVLLAGGGTKALSSIGGGTTDNTKVAKAGDTMTGALTISSTSTNRATLYLRSAANVPNDLWLGTNNENHWSITNRASDESYLLGFYSASAGYTAKINYSTGQWTFTSNPSINGYTNWHSGNDGSGSGLDADKVDGLHFWTGSQLPNSPSSDTIYIIV